MQLYTAKGTAEDARQEPCNTCPSKTQISMLELELIEAYAIIYQLEVKLKNKTLVITDVN